MFNHGTNWDSKCENETSVYLCYLALVCRLEKYMFAFRIKRKQKRRKLLQHNSQNRFPYLHGTLTSWILVCVRVNRFSGFPYHNHLFMHLSPCLYLCSAIVCGKINIFQHGIIWLFASYMPDFFRLKGSYECLFYKIRDNLNTTQA